MAERPWRGAWPRTRLTRDGRDGAPRPGVLHEVTAAQAPLREHPRLDATLDTEALKGERVTIYDRNEEGWSWGQLAHDDYVGWLPSDALRPAGAPPTHAVAALRTFAFPGPDIKLTPIETLSLGCKLRIVREEAMFAVTADHAFVPRTHLAAIAAREADFVAVAERFVGTPYLWGGRTSLGIDCSGLVQVALAAAGIAWPRDTAMQEPLGTRVAANDDFSNLRRGDLIFWSGHVAIARGDGTLVHANAHAMAVTIEPIREAATRAVAGQRSDVSSVRRITAPGQ